MWRAEKIDRAVKRAGALFFIGAVERLFFTRVALPRRIASRVLSETLARIEPEFDAALYLRQFRNALRRRRAARAPALHYAVLGWREHRAPNARFDPTHYRRVTPELAQHAEPFNHYLRIGRPAGVPQNESEAAWQEYSRASEDIATGNRRIADDVNVERVLVLHHGRGGGSGLFLTIYERELVARGLCPLRLRPLTRTSPALFVCEDPSGETHVFDLYKDQSMLVEFAHRLGVTGILVNHVVDMPPDILPWIVSTSDALGVPFDVILHDYFAVCPRVNLVDDGGRFCGVAGVERCRTCLAAGGAEIESPDIAAWRGRFVVFLEKARNVVAPSADAQQRLEPHIGRAISVWSPIEEPAPIRWRAAGGGEPLKVVLIGGLTAAKGADVVYRLACAIRSANAPVELHLIGSSDSDRRLRSAGVFVHGRYREQDVASRIAGLAPHVAFLPSIWPETWSFVLGHALRAGLPTVVFDIGAPADRLQRLGLEELVLPVNFADNTMELLNFFLNFRERPRRESENRSNAEGCKQHQRSIEQLQPLEHAAEGLRNNDVLPQKVAGPSPIA